MNEAHPAPPCHGAARLPLLALLPLLLLGCAKGVAVEEQPVWSFAGPTMGTRYNVTVVGGTEGATKQLQKLVDEHLAVVNRRMSTYDPESELSRFNASDSTEWFNVSEETASVVASALKLADASGGAFDPTVGPLVNLWGFGPEQRRFEPPSDEAITNAKSRVGYDMVEARLDPPALRKSAPRVYVDLSAIAKGDGVDAIANLLTAEGVQDFMVEIGGEVRAAGIKPSGKPWRIGVERAGTAPAAPSQGRPVQRVVELTDRSLATSGDYNNYFEHDGARYSHTIDPTTGRPVTHDLATVTVQADTCREADSLATTLLVLGPDRGYDWAVEQNVAALFVTRSQNDELSERTTPAWDDPSQQTLDATGANAANETEEQ